jgi:hypothetical protein
LIYKKYGVAFGQPLTGVKMDYEKYLDEADVLSIVKYKRARLTDVKAKADERKKLYGAEINKMIKVLEYFRDGLLDKPETMKAIEISFRKLK